MGGGAYVSNAIIGESICASHAGITAEGDNAVLNTKVVSELLALFVSGNTSLIDVPELKSQLDLNNVEHLLWIVSTIVNNLVTFITTELSSTGDKSKSLAKFKFNLSDEIQDLAYALGVRLMIESN